MLENVKAKLSKIAMNGELTYIKDVKVNKDVEIKIRGFVDNIRAQSKVIFIRLREKLDTIQIVYTLKKEATEEEKEEFKLLKKLSTEAFIEITGKAVNAFKSVESCSIKEIEIDCKQIKILGDVYDKLPFLIKDAKATAGENEVTVGYNVRLDNRFLDFRVPATYSMIRVIDETMDAFRRFCKKNDFIEIKTSKIIQSGSEGGANLFSVNYFDRTAYLAQSPQLYKQMAILGGLKRVCEIGHVYRAEVSNINRYLSEFTGMDMEMELEGSYLDFVKYLHTTLCYIFDSLKENRSREMEILREYQHFDDLKYKDEPVIITHREAVDLLKKEGYKIGYEDDFSREEEKVLGGLIKKMHDVDIFTVIDYPADVRAFYTYVDSETGKTRSYDFIMRGEEILSGAQRESDYEKLKKAIIKKGISVESLSNYLEPFKFGAPPHGGCGIGLERFLKAFFGYSDIRYFSLFPRDPNRIYP